MNLQDELGALINERIDFDGYMDYSTNPIILKMINLISKDITQSCDFLENDCSETQFIWLSEIFYEIIEKTHSQKIINSLRKTAIKYPKATNDYNIISFIDEAEQLIK